MDYRKHFSNLLGGRGLEIGPLHNPIPRHDRMTVDTVDRLTVAEMRKHYPELSEYPLREPNIIDDAESLVEIADGTYDSVVASHVIEHMKSPLGALKAWCRVLKPAGILYLVVPDYRRTFDKDRILTSLEHIIADYNDPNEARDWEHYREWAEFVDKLSGETDIYAHALDLKRRGYSIHFSTFTPFSFTNMLLAFSSLICPIQVLEGPVVDGIEFHVLVQKL